MTMCKTKRSLTQILTLVILGSFGLVGCGSGTTGDGGAVTPQGTINLEQLKVGVPQKVLEDAVLTFEVDENPISKAGGKTQFMSRTKDTKDGKYLAQCREGYCFQLQAYYMENPITKEQAVAVLKAMLPSSAPDQSRVDDDQLKDGKTEKPVEYYYFGDKYMGELIYADKSGESVTIVSVSDLDKNGSKDSSPESAESTPKEE